MAAQALPPLKNRRAVRSQERFLAAFSVCGSITQAVRRAKIHRMDHYVWMRTDPTYPPRWKDAEAKAARALEDEAVRRAHEGLRKPVLHKGKPVFVGGQMLYETEYSDTLLIFLLKGLNPDKFRERVDHSFQWDGSLDSLSDSQRDKLLMDVLTLACAGDRNKAGELKTLLEAQARAQIDSGDDTRPETIDITPVAPAAQDQAEQATQNTTAPSLANLFPDAPRGTEEPTGTSGS